MTAFVLAAVTALAAPVPKDAGPAAELEKKVAPAREKAIKFLKGRQDKDGTWESDALLLAGMDGGQTALAVLALLEAGVPANDVALAKAFEFLRNLKSDRTYVVSLRAQVLARADAKTYAKEVQAGADWLLKTRVEKDGKLVGWSYPGNTVADNSNTHFAVMGLHAAARAGAKVDPAVWKQVRDLYARTQHTSGGWAYMTDGAATPSRNMTLAGLLALAVATGYDKGAKGPDPAFEKGMQTLLGHDWKGDGKSAGYAWLTTAELGRALGATEFKAGKLADPWYREAAEKLVKGQREDGSWKSDGAPIDGNFPVIATACGLYLLGPPPRK